ncbi:MAG TPA: DUF4331 domain-containing protein, partial [Gaiellaceae bacterium]|nr:DUF4331 domain-containing protein [Gaiellaceae bacterium]
VAVLRGPAPTAGTASSHREAPTIAEDPSADNTDVYAFRSPDRPDTVTLISNFIPAEDAAAGPMYFEFSPSARYNIYVDRNGDGRAEVTYRFRFRPSEAVAFLRSTVQPYTVTRIEGGRAQVVASGNTPPNNIGPRTTPGYRQVAQNAVTQLEGGGQVFAGQREDAFFGDIGSIFDSLGFRRGTGNAGGGKDFFAGYGVHTISLQVPIAGLNDPDGIIGVWSSAERQQIQVERVTRRVRGRLVRSDVTTRPWVQVSRLGNPLVNEVIIPTARKDAWNRATPNRDSQFVQFFRTPVLAALINQLYPGAIDAPEQNRDDLVQILLTGVPNLNSTGSTQADMLRLNLAIAPTAAVGAGNRLGVLANDLAGYPNGRRLEDDVIDISERAVAGKLLGNARADLLGDGVDANDVPFLPSFPYQADPFSGFENTKGQQKP